MHWITQILKKLLTSGVAAIGTVWTLMEINNTLSIIDVGDCSSKTIIILAGVLWPSVTVFREMLFFNCNIGNSFHLRIRFGNITRRKNGTILVPINHNFFCKKPEPRRLFDKRPESILSQLTIGKDGSEIVQQLQDFHARLNGSSTPMGTCYGVTTHKRSLLFMSQTRHVEAGKCASSHDEIMQALNNLFADQTKLNIENYTIYMPVLGTGKSGANLSYDNAIKMIAKAFVYCSSHKDENSSRRIRTVEIVIRWKDLQNIDNWVQTCEDIKNIAHLCGDCKQ